MADQKTGRKAREEEARRNHILGVSERLFAKQGLHNTSVAEIARAAEFGIGTIYKYFKDKTTLIQCLMEDRVNTHFDDLENAIAKGGTPNEIIDAVVEAYFDSVTDAKDFFGMFYTHFHPGPKDDPHGSPLNLEFLQQRKFKFIEMTRQVFAKGIDQGLIVNIDPDYLAAAFLGILISFFCFAEGKFSGEWDVDGMRKAVKEILLRGVLSKEEKTETRVGLTVKKTDYLETTGETS